MESGESMGKEPSSVEVSVTSASELGPSALVSRAIESGDRASITGPESAVSSSYPMISALQPASIARAHRPRPRQRSFARVVALAVNLSRTRRQ
jgi:hypothetical protein